MAVMKLSDFDYYLPKALIAQKPVSPRDHSRLMVVDRQKKKIGHRHFSDLPDYLQPGDVLVLNDTKVFPARLIGRRQETGGKVEVFLLKPVSGNAWEALIGNRRKRIGQVIEFQKDLNCKIISQIDDSVWLVKFNKSGNSLEKLIDQIGLTPLPPYIKAAGFKDRYQTVYAENRGSAAAPTAGFHFTKGLIGKLKKKGVQFEFVTLHVGLGTFEPVKENDVKKHKMHSEYALLNKATAGRLNQAKKEGRRIIAVGTTSVRTLESFNQRGKFKVGRQWTDIFIYPGYKFKAVDAMITNFHLPKSTLLMLVMAFARKELIIKAYRAAINKKYRFYSFGDAMLII